MVKCTTYIRMGEIGTVCIWSPKTRSAPEFVHWAVHGPHAPSCPGRRAKKIGSFFLQNFEIVNLVSAHLASAVRSAKKIQGACEHQRRQGNVDRSSQGSRTNIEDIEEGGRLPACDR